MIDSKADYKVVANFDEGIVVDGWIMPKRDVDWKATESGLRRPRTLRGEDCAFCREGAYERYLLSVGSVMPSLDQMKWIGSAPWATAVRLIHESAGAAIASGAAFATAVTETSPHWDDSITDFYPNTKFDVSKLKSDALKFATGERLSSSAVRDVFHDLSIVRTVSSSRHLSRDGDEYSVSSEGPNPPTAYAGGSTLYHYASARTGSEWFDPAKINGDSLAKTTSDMSFVVTNAGAFSPTASIGIPVSISVSEMSTEGGGFHDTFHGIAYCRATRDGSTFTVSGGDVAAEVTSLVEMVATPKKWTDLPDIPDGLSSQTISASFGNFGFAVVELGDHTDFSSIGWRREDYP